MTMASPQQIPNIDRPTMSVSPANTASPTTRQPQLQQLHQPTCNCIQYHSQGLGCPCNAVYAIKVGRKATERILARSKFFTKSKLLVQTHTLKEWNSDKKMDDSTHSAANQILKLDRNSVKLGKVLGKGGFCVVYEASLPSLVQNHRDNGTEGQVMTNGKSTSESVLTSGTTTAEATTITASVPIDHDDDEEETTTESSDQHYCVKFLKPSVLPERKKFARGIADLAIEAHFLASLNHPHILKIRGVSESFQLFNPSSPSFLADVTHEPELSGGCFLLLDQLAITLDKKITQEWKETQFYWNSFLNRTVQDMRGTKRKLFKLERLTVALQLAQAMQYLHQHNICYRDLKPDNIGFDLQDSLKLFDFGLAKELKDYKRHVDGTYQLTANTGSKRYMAPEVASRERYNLSVDVFSYGILFWEICSLEKPFDGFTEVQHMNLVVQRGHRPRLDALKNWPVSVKHIISRCWHPISNERPTFRQVVNALIQIQSEMSDN